MRHCKNCGSEVDEGDIYCGYCGSKLDDAMQDGKSAKQNFEGFDEIDISSDFDKEFDDMPKDNADKKIYDGAAELGKDENEFQSFDSQDINQTADDGGNTQRKPLQFNQVAKSANSFGIAALIFGILGGVFGIVFGIIGLQKAKKALELCATGEYDGKPQASNGKILSIVGIVLGAISIVTYIL